MYWLVDESQNFIFQDVSPMSWKIAAVCGAAVPYAGRKKWLSKYASIGKASDYKQQDETKICSILNDMIDCKVQGVLIITDIGHTSVADAEKFRFGLINPHYAFADKEPTIRGRVLKSHLDNLLGRGRNALSLQDFYKIWNILEIIAAHVKLFISKLPKIRSIDLRQLRLIIDDQAKASLIVLKEFVHYFLLCRSQEGMFNFPPGTMNRMNRHLWADGERTYLNTNSLLNEILVGEHGANMDDKYPELKIADLFSNFSRRVLNGQLSFKVAQKLDQILKIKVSLHANPNMQDIIVNTPPGAGDAIKLLMG